MNKDVNEAIGEYLARTACFALGGVLMYSMLAQDMNREPLPPIVKYVAVECSAPKPLTIEEKIRVAALAANVSPDVALAIAQCESRLDPYAANPVSSAKGLYQFTDGTWAYIKAQGHQFDADENIKQFMLWYPLHPSWWSCE